MNRCSAPVPGPKDLWLYRKGPFPPDEPYTVSNKWELKTDLGTHVCNVYERWTLQMIQSQHHSSHPWQRTSCCELVLLCSSCWGGNDEFQNWCWKTTSKNPDCWWCGFSFLVWPGPGVTHLQVFIFCLKIFWNNGSNNKRGKELPPNFSKAAMDSWKNCFSFGVCVASMQLYLGFYSWNLDL